MFTQQNLLLPQNFTTLERKEHDAFIIATDSLCSEPRYILAFGDTEQEAKDECEREARKQGWTPPRWWQFWRLNDSVAPQCHQKLQPPRSA